MLSDNNRTSYEHDISETVCVSFFGTKGEERNLTFGQNIKQCLSVEQTKAPGNSTADIKGERFKFDHSPPPA